MLTFKLNFPLCSRDELGQDRDFCSLELESGETAEVPEARDGWLKVALQGGTEQSLPRQARGKGVCKQTTPICHPAVKELFSVD